MKILFVENPNALGIRFQIPKRHNVQNTNAISGYQAKRFPHQQQQKMRSSHGGKQQQQQQQQQQSNYQASPDNGRANSNSPAPE